jgi:hypothetical protein
MRLRIALIDRQKTLHCSDLLGIVTEQRNGYDLLIEERPLDLAGSDHVRFWAT